MIISVSNFEEAKNYPVLFNTSEILMDNNRDVFYVKAVDGLGKYDIKTYKFEQIENERPLSAENFVTRQQFDSLNTKLDQMIQFMAQSQPMSDNQGGMNDGQFDTEQQKHRSSKSR